MDIERVCGGHTVCGAGPASQCPVIVVLGGFDMEGSCYKIHAPKINPSALPNRKFFLHSPLSYIAHESLSFFPVVGLICLPAAKPKTQIWYRTNASLLHEELSQRLMCELRCCRALGCWKLKNLFCMKSFHTD